MSVVDSRNEQRVLGDYNFARGLTEKATTHYQRCLEISPAMARTFITMLRAAGVPLIVAPYEADAQLGYLCRQGYIQGVVSDDGDMLCYGCSPLVSKLDGDGNCVVVDSSLFLRGYSSNVGQPMTLSRLTERLRCSAANLVDHGRSVADPMALSRRQSQSWVDDMPDVVDDDRQHTATMIKPAVPSIDSDPNVIETDLFMTRDDESERQSDGGGCKTSPRRMTSMSFTAWSLDLFIFFCILCGCDYLDPVPSIGPKRVCLKRFFPLKKS